jgi:hypothetical protein
MNKAVVLIAVQKCWTTITTSATKRFVSELTELTEWEVHHAATLLIADGDITKERAGRFIAYTPSLDFQNDWLRNKDADLQPTDEQPADEQPSPEQPAPEMDEWDDAECTQRVIDAVSKACIEQNNWVGLSNFIGLGTSSELTDEWVTVETSGEELRQNVERLGRFHQPAGHRS